jgi:hypothetical protein
MSSSSNPPAGERRIDREDEMQYRLSGRDLKSNEPCAPLDIEADSEEAARTQAVEMGMEVLQIERFQPLAIEAPAGPDSIAKHPAKRANRIKVIAFVLMVSGLLVAALNPVIQVVYRRVGVRSGTLADEPVWVLWWLGVLVIGSLGLLFAATVNSYYGLTQSKGPRMRAFAVKVIIFACFFGLLFTSVCIAKWLWFPDKDWVLDYLLAIGTLLVLVFTVKRTRIKKEEAAEASKG